MVMNGTFEMASSFKQDLSLNQLIAYNSLEFDGYNVVDETTAFTPTEVDLMYNGWLNGMIDMSYGALGYLEIGTLQYTAASTVSRMSLINDYGWTILDGGQA